MSETADYAGPYRRSVALRRSQAMLVAMAERDGQQYNTDASKGPIGIAPGQPIGRGRKCHPSLGYAVYATSIRAARAADSYFVEVPPEAAELPDGSVRLDGEDVPITRTGTTRTAADFAEVADEPPITRR